MRSLIHSLDSLHITAFKGNTQQYHIGNFHPGGVRSSISPSSSLCNDHNTTAHDPVPSFDQNTTGMWNLKKLDYLGREGEVFSRGVRECGRAGFGDGLPLCNQIVPVYVKGRLLFLFGLFCDWSFVPCVPEGGEWGEKSAARVGTRM